LRAFSSSRSLSAVSRCILRSLTNSSATNTDHTPPTVAAIATIIQLVRVNLYATLWPNRYASGCSTAAVEASAVVPV
jgi:hypothetical protein